MIRPNFIRLVPLSRIEFAADRACKYVSDLSTGQSARTSESQRAGDHGQSAVVIPRVNLSFSFLPRFSRVDISLTLGPIRINSKQSG